MKNILPTFSARQWGTIIAGICAAVIASVLISQYGFNFHPCHLCLYQRVPYYAAFGVASVLSIFGQNKKIARALLAVLIMCFIASLYLSTFHMGVEYKWWTYDSGCSSGNIFKPGASTADILAALKAAPVIKCDDRVEFLFGMTMAFYNVLTSVFMIALSVFAYRSSSLSQYK